MNQIPPGTKRLYEAHLKNKGIAKTAQVYYQKWLRYYLDFCGRYRYQKFNKNNLDKFIQKLKEKNQNEQQVKQAFHAISLFYELRPVNSGKDLSSFEAKIENLSQ